MAYIDGVMAPTKADDRDAFIAAAKTTAALFREYGATRVVDGWGADVPDGTRTDMKRAVAAEPGEIVTFGWIEWPDKATRDAAWGKLMADPRMQGMTMPFDGKRMIFGGFEVVSEA